MSAATDATIAARYRRSPRTVARPMAFTAWEFSRGALLTYGTFLLLTALISLWMGPVGALYSLFYAVPIAGATLLLIGAPLALAGGLALRSYPAMWLHLLVHGAIGLAAGYSGITMFFIVTSWGSSGTWGADDWTGLLSVSTIYLPYVLVTAPCAMFGWWVTSRLALGLWNRPVRADATADEAAEHPLD